MQLSLNDSTGSGSHRQYINLDKLNPIPYTKTKSQATDIMSATDYKFEGRPRSQGSLCRAVLMCPNSHRISGWGAFGPDSVEGNFKKFEYEPKPWEETDVDSTSMPSIACAENLRVADIVLLVMCTFSQDHVLRCRE